MINLDFWRSVASSWIVIYKEEDRNAAEATAESYIETSDRQTGGVPSIISILNDWTADDDDDYL